MKKYIFLFFVFASANAFAQEKWTLGLELGSNITGQHVYNISPTIHNNLKIGFVKGVEVAYSPNEKLTFRLQIFMDQRTVSFSEPVTDTLYYKKDAYILEKNTLESSRTTDYFEIPLTVKYALIGERSQGYVFAGPVFAVKTSPGESNFALTGGIGFSHSFHMVSLFVEGAYSFGLKNISEYEFNDDPHRRLSNEPYYSEFSRDFRINTGLLFNID